MSSGLRLALTADLHWGHGRGADATRLLASYIQAHPPDVLVLAGDLGTGARFDDCLALFDGVPGRKALVPGNHDVWVPTNQTAPDSLQVYEDRLPAAAAAHGFHYLDHGPLLLPEADLALVGSMNWYDYSWALDALRRFFPAELDRLQTKAFTRGRHNDANFVRWPLDDESFTARVVARFDQHLRSALEQVSRVVVVTHHPPCYALGFPRPEPPTFLDQFLWDAFCGNQAMQDVLVRNADRIAFAFCGHTHRARTADFHGIRGFNIGGDYHFKRVLLLDWPAGTVTPHQFGDAEDVSR